MSCSMEEQFYQTRNSVENLKLIYSNLFWTEKQTKCTKQSNKFKLRAKFMNIFTSNECFVTLMIQLKCAKTLYSCRLLWLFQTQIVLQTIKSRRFICNIHLFVFYYMNRLQPENFTALKCAMHTSYRKCKQKTKKKRIKNE